MSVCWPSHSKMASWDVPTWPVPVISFPVIDQPEPAVSSRTPLLLRNPMRLALMTPALAGTDADELACTP